MSRIYLSNNKTKRSPNIDTSNGKVLNPSPRLKKGIDSKSNSLKDKSLLDNKSVNYSANYSYSNLFSSLLIILVGVAIVRVLYFGSADTVSLGTLLDLFKGVPQVSTSVKTFVQQLQLTDPWPILDGLRYFININLQMSSIIIWLASSLIDVCFFITYFLVWLFI